MKCRVSNVTSLSHGNLLTDFGAVPLPTNVTATSSSIVAIDARMTVVVQSGDRAGAQALSSSLTAESVAAQLSTDLGIRPKPNTTSGGRFRPNVPSKAAPSTKDDANVRSPIIFSKSDLLSRLVFNCFYLPQQWLLEDRGRGRDTMQEEKVRLADNEVKEGTACAAARLALVPMG